MRRLVATAILVLTAPLALAGAGCGGGGGGDEAASVAPAVEKGVPASTGGSEASGSGSAPSVAPNEAREADAVAVARSAIPATGPRVIQTATVRLAVARGRFDETIERARTIAAGLGGFVTSSTASKGTGERLVRGSLVLRVPEQAYARAMAQLGRLGTVEGREESGQDVSAQYVDLEARSRHLEAVESQLLELLEKADTVPAALAVQAQLNSVQLELEQVRGQLRYLDDQTSFATISLDVRERVPAGASGDDDGWGIVSAWSDGARAFVRVAGGIFVALATAGPILAIIALAALGWRIAARRRVAAGSGQG